MAEKKKTNYGSGSRYPQSTRLDYSQTRKELREKGPACLYLLWGQEEYLIRDFVSRVRELCLSEGTADFNEKILEGPVPDYIALQDAVNSMPFFSGRVFVYLKQVDIKEFFKNDKLKDLFSDIPEWCTVLITVQTGQSPDSRLSLTKLLKAKGKIIEFTEQSDADLYKWMLRRFNSLGKHIAQDTARYLTFLCGNLMNGLIPEIEKIAAFAPNEEITRKDIDQIAHHIPDADAFFLTNCLADRDYDGAAAVLREMLEQMKRPEDLLGALGAIHWQFRRLFAARIVMDYGLKREFVTDIYGGMSPEKLRNLFGCAKKYTAAGLANNIRLLAEIDFRSKSNEFGTENMEDLMKEMLIGFAMEEPGA